MSNMSYTVIIKQNDGRVTSSVYNFVDTKNGAVSVALQNDKTISIEVFYNVAHSTTGSAFTEKWVKSKTWWNPFSKPKWVQIAIPPNATAHVRAVASNVEQIVGNSGGGK